MLAIVHIEIRAKQTHPPVPEIKGPSRPSAKSRRRLKKRI